MRRLGNAITMLIAGGPAEVIATRSYVDKIPQLGLQARNLLTLSIFRLILPMLLPIVPLPPGPQVANGTKSSKKNRPLGSISSHLHHPSWSTITPRDNQMHRASSVVHQQPPCSFVSELRQLPEEGDTPMSVLLGAPR